MVTIRSAAALPTDCLIVGGGPAGLTAALYLARFHLRVSVVDSGQSRCETIPLSRNHAGFPDGISGRDLLTRMRRQTAAFGAGLIDAVVKSIAAHSDQSGFRVETSAAHIEARTVLLATGVANHRPRLMDKITHDKAVAQGLVRYCPICDGYEVTDAKVAVLGTGQRGHDEALFLRSYTRDIVLVAPDGAHALDADQQARLADAGIALAHNCVGITLAPDKIVLTLPDGNARFDTLYPALGSRFRSELGRQLGAQLSQEGCLAVDAHQRTTIRGLYAAGDVVLGLDQISHAMGEGAVAATAIRNDLAKLYPLRR